MAFQDNPYPDRQRLPGFPVKPGYHILPATPHQRTGPRRFRRHQRPKLVPELLWRWKPNRWNTIFIVRNYIFRMKTCIGLRFEIPTFRLAIRARRNLRISSSVFSGEHGTADNFNPSAVIKLGSRLYKHGQTEFG